MSIKQGIYGTLIALASMTAACAGSGHSHEKTDDTSTEQQSEDKQGKEYTSAYVCPMHCQGSGSDQPGTCPVCGMEYVVNDKKDNKDHEGHQH